jgi:hypothetical protein
MKYVYTLKYSGAVSSSSVEAESPLDVHDAIMDKHGIKLTVRRVGPDDGPPAPERKILAVRFDVTELTDEEIDGLVGEVTVQAEVSELHPSVHDVRTDLLKL